MMHGAPVYAPNVPAIVIGIPGIGRGDARTGVGSEYGQANERFLKTGSSVVGVELVTIGGLCGGHRLCRVFRIFSAECPFETYPARRIHRPSLFRDAFSWIPEEIGYPRAHTLDKGRGRSRCLGKPPSPADTEDAMHHALQPWLYDHIISGEVSKDAKKQGRKRMRSVRGDLTRSVSTALGMRNAGSITRPEF
jgi:hypothetical protein